MCTSCDIVHIKLVVQLLPNMLLHVLGNSPTEKSWSVRPSEQGCCFNSTLSSSPAQTGLSLRQGLIDKPVWAGALLKQPLHAPDNTETMWRDWSRSPLPASLRKLQQRITTTVETVTQDMLQRVWRELDYWLDVCRVTGSEHFFVYLFTVEETAQGQKQIKTANCCCPCKEDVKQSWSTAGETLKCSPLEKVQIIGKRKYR